MATLSSLAFDIQSDKIIYKIALLKSMSLSQEFLFDTYYLFQNDIFST